MARHEKGSKSENGSYEKGSKEKLYIREAKNEWFLKKGAEAQRGCHNSPPRQQIDDPSSREETVKTIHKLKHGKANGRSGMLPDMRGVASCNEDFLDVLMELVGVVEKKKCVPRTG